jgi:P-type E1-E2 ATPase
MIELHIPGYRRLKLEHVVFDYNGTLAVDGELLAGVCEALTNLAAGLRVHILTADTFGSVKRALGGVPCTVNILPPSDQDEAKRQYVQTLGADKCICVGNGRNDRLMLQDAAVGIAVILAEGAAAQTLAAADVVCTEILAAMELLQHPLRLTATLRC